MSIYMGKPHGPKDQVVHTPIVPKNMQLLRIFNFTFSPGMEGQVLYVKPVEKRLAQKGV